MKPANMPAVYLPTVLGLEPSFGFGDRLGCATPGHLEALRREGGPIQPIFAQQSIREMARTNRNPTQVMSAAITALAKAKYEGKWGADADHLKTEADVAATADAGFCFFTIDPSAHVDQKADGYRGSTLDEKFAAVKDRIDWISQYEGKTIAVRGGPKLSFDAATVRRAAVKYGLAILHTIEMAGHVKKRMQSRGCAFELELSVDETEQPTTLAEHYIIADQLRRAGVRIVSLAPRYVGDFEKGVDYKEDPRTPGKLEESLREHAAIARELGPYKLSLHSGSDKLSMYGLFARATGGCFHVKTAGTSYLEALRVVARHDGALFRRIIDFARQRYDTDKATYHVSATVAGVPAPKDITDARKLEAIYLEHWADVPTGKGFTSPGRQILHCTFGSVLTDATLGPALHAVLKAHPDTYTHVLADHFGKHLAALRGGM